MSNLWTVILASAGLFLATYILHMKRKGQKLVCFIGEDCNKVLNSKYSSLFFNIPNEALGIAYYITVLVLAVLSLIGITTLASLPIAALMLGAIIPAAIVAIVLTVIQLAIIREWCEYCLASTLITLGILVVQFV